MNWTTTRFGLRRQRLELTLFGLALLVLAGLSAWTALSILGLHIEECRVEPVRATLAVCDQPTIQLNEITKIMPLLQALAVFIPPIAGLFLGVTIVARETESGTAMFAWSYGTSRTRWLMGRVLPVLAILVPLAALAGSAVDAVYAASYPEVRISDSLIDYQVRGPLLASRAALAFSVALLVGAVIGRLLPALLVSIVLCGAVVGGSMALGNGYARRDTVIEPGRGSLLTGVLFRDDDGNLLDEATAVAQVPPGVEFHEAYQVVDVGVPGERSVAIVAVIATATFIVTVLVIGLAIVVTSKRRPY